MFLQAVSVRGNSLNMRKVFKYKIEFLRDYSGSILKDKD